MNVKKMKSYPLFQRIVLNILSSLPLGRLTVTLADGEVHTFGKDDRLCANMTILDDQFFRHTVLQGDIGFGEAFVNGYWKSTAPTAVVSWLLLNREYLPGGKQGKGDGLLWNALHISNRLKHFLRRNTRRGSRRNIEAHYDLGNDFYQLFLDKNMTYSSAYFTHSLMNLEDAQEEKYRQICQKINLHKKDHVLEVGCGWGGFSLFAAQNYGCRVSAVTISPSQFKLAKQRIEKAGMQDRIDLRLCDYRELRGRYDKVVSIEMIEAVGHDFLEEYFKKLQSLSTEEGIIALQAITIPDSRYQYYRKSSDWIRKHIFPGGHLPAIGMINKALNKSGPMHPVHLESFGLHYARTLGIWRHNLKNREEEALAQGKDARFLRKWYFYFHTCEAAFLMRNVNVVQIVFTNPNNTAYFNPAEAQWEPAFDEGITTSQVRAGSEAVQSFKRTSRKKESAQLLIS